MKEKIYTIPINEAMEKKEFCPFCSLMKKLEADAIRYTIGPAMMEPDFRIITNEKGFCKKHMRELNAQSKALPLSLVLETHLQGVLDILSEDLESDKKSLFKKSDDKAEAFTQNLEKIKNSCAVCDKINSTFADYVYTFVYMLKNEKGFLDKALECEGFCMEHFTTLARCAKKELSKSDYNRCFLPIVELQRKRVEKFKNDVKTFSDSFDYRNAGKKCEIPSDILLKAGYLLNGEFKPKSKKLENI